MGKRERERAAGRGRVRACVRERERACARKRAETAAGPFAADGEKKGGVGRGELRERRRSRNMVSVGEFDVM